MSSSPSTPSDRWLRSVIKDYASLTRQWSAFLTMIQSCPPHGYVVSLTPSHDIPKLLVSAVQASSRRIGDGIGTSSGTQGYFGLINGPFWTGTGGLGQSLGQAPPRPLDATKTAPTMAKSTSSKRATCRSAQQQSGT